MRMAHSKWGKRLVRVLKILHEEILAGTEPSHHCDAHHRYQVELGENRCSSYHNIFIYVEPIRWPIGESIRFWSCRLWFDSESGQTNDCKIGIHSFPAKRSTLKGQCGEQTGKFTCGAVGKDT